MLWRSRLAPFNEIVAANERMAQQGAAVPAQASSSDDTMTKLQKLADMKSQGLLSDQEFAAMKGKLLGI